MLLGLNIIWDIVLFSVLVADAILLFISSFFLYYGTCNKFNKVKVASSFRIAHEEIVFLFIRGHKELESHM